MRTTEPAFAGLTATPANGNIMWNLVLGIAIFLGRLLPVVPVMALAGALAGKNAAPADAGSFPVAGGTFVLLLTATIVIVAALTFFPALAVGPVVEHYLMTGSRVTF